MIKANIREKFLSRGNLNLSTTFWVGWINRSPQKLETGPSHLGSPRVYGKTKNRSVRNLGAADLSGFAGARDDVPLLGGVMFRSGDEHTIWKAVSRERGREDWRDLDLILLA